MIHFLGFYVKRLKRANFKECYSTKRSTFQNFYANRLKSKNFYSIKSALFRISMQMKIHLLYCWINIRGTNPPPRNNICGQFFKIFSQNQWGGSTCNSIIYLPQVRGWGGGGLRPNPPTLAPLAHENISIHSFIVFVYVFVHSFVQLFIYSFILNGISIYFCTDPLYMYMYITTLNRNEMCI